MGVLGGLQGGQGLVIGAENMAQSVEYRHAENEARNNQPGKFANAMYTDLQKLIQSIGGMFE